MYYEYAEDESEKMFDRMMRMYLAFKKNKL